MLRIHLSELTTDHKLARSVYRDSGELLLSSGYRVTLPVLKKLHEGEQELFWIIEDALEDFIPVEIINEQLSRQSTLALKDNAAGFKKALKTNLETVDDINKAMSDTSKFKDIIAADKIRTSTLDIIAQVMGSEGAMINLSGIRSQSNYTYQHAVETTVVALILGTHFAFNKTELEQLAMGTMLMDTGYLVMPDDLVRRRGRVSFQEYSLLKEHTTYGFQILRENPRIPLVSAHIAYQHHERQDGGGYPRRLKGSNLPPHRPVERKKKAIHRFAEIAAVADYYVSLQSPRDRADSKTPSEIITLLIKAAGTGLNTSIVDTLITKIPVYPVGARIVVVEDSLKGLQGFSGVVAQSSKEFPESPIIVLLFNKEKERIDPAIRIDLQFRADMKIQFQVLKGQDVSLSLKPT